MTKPIPCPRCSAALHEVFFGDDVRRWRCMRCGRVFSGVEWMEGDGELVRRTCREKAVEDMQL